jgi:hypothetical protein
MDRRAPAVLRCPPPGGGRRRAVDRRQLSSAARPGRAEHGRRAPDRPGGRLLAGASSDQRPDRGPEQPGYPNGRQPADRSADGGRPCGGSRRVGSVGRGGPLPRARARRPVNDRRPDRTRSRVHRCRPGGSRGPGSRECRRGLRAPPGSRQPRHPPRPGRASRRAECRGKARRRDRAAAAHAVRSRADPGTEASGHHDRAPEASRHLSGRRPRQGRHLPAQTGPRRPGARPWHRSHGHDRGPRHPCLRLPLGREDGLRTGALRAGVRGLRAGPRSR